LVWYYYYQEHYYIPAPNEIDTACVENSKHLQRVWKNDVNDVDFDMDHGTALDEEDGEDEDEDDDEYDYENGNNSAAYKRYHHRLQQARLQNPTIEYMRYSVKKRNMYDDHRNDGIDDGNNEKKVSPAIAAGAGATCWMVNNSNPQRCLQRFLELQLISIETFCQDPLRNTERYLDTTASSVENDIDVLRSGCAGAESF
jgi:hypothetical protein